MLAPFVAVRQAPQNNIAAYILTSKQVVSVQLPSFGKSLLDLIESSIRNEMDIDGEDEQVEEQKHTKQEINGDSVTVSMNAVQRITCFVQNKDWKDARVLLNELKTQNATLEQCAFHLMVDGLVENEQWQLLQEYFVLVTDHSETNLLYLLSLLINHLTYFMDDESFCFCLNTVLSVKINDIFMKRCIQILPQAQVEMFVKYLCHLLCETNKSETQQRMNMETVVMWINIVFDAHLATLAFSHDEDEEEESERLRNHVLRIKQSLKQYDEKMKSMMEVQANIHSILNEMKIEYQNTQQNKSVQSGNSAKAMHGIGGGAFGSHSTSNEQEANLYKDYVVEYIKL
mmetsp:Transcript_71645/g.114035  ORF Transcript_71645/g.114035 Transcript_71645/m.114035 type:complete len:343 (+) Transcript_71645:2-1030(+)